MPWPKGRPRPQHLRELHSQMMRGRRYDSPALRSRNQSGERNTNWAGAEVGYSGLHKWVRQSKPRTEVCSVCAAEGYTEFANLSGEYRRDLDDFAEMCVPCHRIYDQED